MIDYVFLFCTMSDDVSSEKLLRNIFSLPLAGAMSLACLLVLDIAQISPSLYLLSVSLIVWRLSAGPPPPPPEK